MSAAPWVCDHWIATWFAVRHTGGFGQSAQQARQLVRYWIRVKREAVRIDTSSSAVAH